MNKGVAIVLVSNDLTTDQRVHRTCMTLLKLGYTVKLTGRRLPGSMPLQPRMYQTTRLKLLAMKGPLLYGELNLRFFFFLLFHRISLVVSNDLDTLPAAWFACRFRKIFFKPGIQHLHDCHEYFRGVPELVGRKMVTGIWKRIEDLIFPRLRIVTAVNESVAELYRKEYHVAITILRNVPFRNVTEAKSPGFLSERIRSRKVILYQGAVNIGRGLEEAVAAMKYIKTSAILVIVGIGDIYHAISQYILAEKLEDKVFLTGQVPFENLRQYTSLADLGLSIEKDFGVNYHYCLPNKFLDYIQAGVPVLVSPFPEMRKIVEKYTIGDFLISHDPEILARQMDDILSDGQKLQNYRLNMAAAAEELCWEKEENNLIELLNQNLNFCSP